MSSANSFRGIKGIREAKERIERLANWLLENRPAARFLHCQRSDYDLIKRWPKAADIEGFQQVDGNIWFKGFQIHHDAAQGRYEKPARPVQETIE